MFKISLSQTEFYLTRNDKNIFMAILNVSQNMQITSVITYFYLHENRGNACE